MNLPQIKTGDLPWIILAIAECFLIGAILIFIEFTFLTVTFGFFESSGEGKVSKVQHEQSLFQGTFTQLDCEDKLRQEEVGATGDMHRRDAAHKQVCDEMRRIAEGIVEKATQKYHPNGPGH